MTASEPPDSRPSTVPTWRPPPQGSDDQWNGMLMDIRLGVAYEMLREKYKLSGPRAELLLEVYASALANDVASLNGLRQEWMFAD